MDYYLPKVSRVNYGQFLKVLEIFKIKYHFSLALFINIKSLQLKYFIEETIDLIQNGYIYNDINRKFIIDCFICDALVRAYICCIKSHGGYYACNKCKTKGM